MHFSYIIQAALGVFSALLAVIMHGAWGRARLKYLFLYGLFLCALCVGVTIEMTAKSVEEAWIGLSLCVLSSAIAPPCVFLYYRQNSETPVKSRYIKAALFLPPVFLAARQITGARVSANFFEYPSSARAAGFYLSSAPSLARGARILYCLTLLLLAVFGLARVVLNSDIRSHKEKAAFTVGFLLLGCMSTFGAAASLCGFLREYGGFYSEILFAAFGAALYLYSRRFRYKDWFANRRSEVIQKMSDAYLLVDTSGGFIDANEAAFRYFPQLRDAEYGENITEIEGLPANIATAYIMDASLSLEAPDGSEIALKTTHSKLIMDGRQAAVSVMVYDNTETHMLMQKMRTMAQTDSLTGILNRGAFFEQLEHDYHLCVRNKTTGAVLMMDLDHFKKVNDSYGHISGDRVLIAVTGLIKSRLRHTDVLGRYGGEEIIAWLPMTDLSGARFVAESIRETVEKLKIDTFTEHGEISVTISIGVADVNHNHPCSYQEIIANADMALYMSKNTGRNKVCAFEYEGEPDRDANNKPNRRKSDKK
ncbi:MAG: sensor domain-containing diguanylate cyclase [Clostridiales bacterium]|nr:sensor domain-containing diguanylate cyclase [Clostridiales bacterium]